SILLDRLREVSRQPAFVEAVRVASPALYAPFAAWLAKPKEEPDDRLEQSLIRYFSRASYRTTPFGLFAGCSLMTVGGTTRLGICSRADYPRYSRIDMDHIAELGTLPLA